MVLRHGHLLPDFIITWIYAQRIYSLLDHYLMIILTSTHHLTGSDKKDITNILTFTKNSLISLPIALISLVIIIFTINNPYLLTKQSLSTY
jgi:hypothetical protein